MLGYADKETITIVEWTYNINLHNLVRAMGMNPY